MKYKQKVDFIINIFLLLIGIVLLFLGILNIGDSKVLFVSIMVLYAILNLIQYILTKQNKDYALSDAIRDELLTKGIELIDTREGTTYKINK